MKQILTIFTVLIVFISCSQAAVQNSSDNADNNRCKQCIKTGKERLGLKGDDEQRVNDCKVPIQQRGSKLRSADCAHKKHRSIKTQQSL
jgi:ribosomal protein L27